MIVRFGLLTRREDLSTEAFGTYWRGNHADVVKATMPNLRGYIQNHVVDRSQKGIDYKRISIEIDGMAQLFFNSLADTRGFSDQAKIKTLQDDEQNFLGGIAILTAFQNVVVKPPITGKFAKRMSLIRKRPDVTMEQFQDEWLNTHPILVKRLPGLLGYRQNIVIDRQKDRLKVDESGDDIQVDGVVELWFESAAATEEAFRSPRGLTAMSHAQEFLGEISTYMVDVTEVIREPKV